MSNFIFSPDYSTAFHGVVFVNESSDKVIVWVHMHSEWKASPRIPSGESFLPIHITMGERIRWRAVICVTSDIPSRDKVVPNLSASRESIPVEPSAISAQWSGEHVCVASMLGRYTKISLC
jgi:hypothetical protein